MLFSTSVSSSFQGSGEALLHPRVGWVLPCPPPITGISSAPASPRPPQPLAEHILVYVWPDRLLSEHSQTLSMCGHAPTVCRRVSWRPYPNPASAPLGREGQPSDLRSQSRCCSGSRTELGLPGGGMLANTSQSHPRPSLLATHEGPCGAPCLSLDLLVGQEGEQKQT